ncbi:hypothetical protein L7F22_037345 [Adiantum nelumboides]|nr:hypothetical protein [Adiantum nelumboides]
MLNVDLELAVKDKVSRYDLSASTYSPDGRIFQIEYAQKAVESAGTVIAIKCKDGIVLGIEKLIDSKMLLNGDESSTNRRIFTIDEHIGLATAGLVADGRHLANRAREEASNFNDTYRFNCPLKVTLSDRLSLYISAYTLYSSVRPFGGINHLGWNRSGWSFHLHDRTFWCILGYHGTAIGKGRQLARTEIEKLNLGELSCEEGVDKVAEIIYKVHDDSKDKDFEMELAWIGPQSSNKFQLVPKELKEVSLLFLFYCLASTNYDKPLRFSSFSLWTCWFQLDP